MTRTREEKRAVCYVRVSTEEQATEGVSLEAQTERLEAYCKAQGLEIVALVREEGVSASKPLSTRPGGADLLATLKRSKAGNVVALKLDRLFRDAVDALTLTQEWDRAGVALHLVDMGGQALNTASAMGRCMLGMLAGFAELERNLISERTAQALAYKKAHREVYNHAPFGFDRAGNKLEENPAELRVVARIRAWREREGLTLQQIADKLNGSKTPTKKGGTWHPSTIRYILSNSLYQTA